MLRIRPFLFALTILLAACSGTLALPELPLSDTIEPESTERSEQSAERIRVGNVNRSNPQEVFQGFMAAWASQDFESMYSFVSPRSKEFYPFEIFKNRYEVAQEQLNFVSVDTRLEDLIRQGSTVMIAYEADIDSGVFGVIEDPGRIMRLVDSPQGWQVAWSPQDILPGYIGGVRIEAQSNFPARGDILDRLGRPLAQEGGTIVTIGGIKQDMPDEEVCIDLIAKMTLRPPAAIEQRFRPFAGDTYFAIAEIDPDAYRLYQNDLLTFCDIRPTQPPFDKVSQYQSRAYYGHGAAAHITGYVGRVPLEEAEFWRNRGYSERDIVGLAGIERAYQDDLAGRPQRILRVIEPGGNVIRELGEASGESAKDVTLTIDRDLQMIVAQAMADAFATAEINWASRARGMGAVVMDVNTGEILALASYPTYDPGRFNPANSFYDPNELGQIVGSPLNPLENKVLKQYAPGSIYKILTTMATASENIYPPDQIFSCGHYWNGQERFGDVLPQRTDWTLTDGLPPTGPVNMAQALTTSCDPFYFEMGALLFQNARPNALVEYSEMLGLGSPTGIEVLGREDTGNLAPPSTIGDAINNAVGQGNVQVTAIQMAVVTSAIANGGAVYQPYIVQSVGDERFNPEVARQLEIEPSVLQIVRDGMCNVPYKREVTGTAWWVFNDVFDDGTEYFPAGYTVCGKTGTAESGVAGAHAWFVAYAPQEDPEIAVVVVGINASREGSEVAAPVVRRILDHYFNQPVKPYPDFWSEEFVPLAIPGEAPATPTPQSFESEEDSDSGLGVGERAE